MILRLESIKYFKAIMNCKLFTILLRDQKKVIDEVKSILALYLLLYNTHKAYNVEKLKTKI